VQEKERFLIFIGVHLRGELNDALAGKMEDVTAGQIDAYEL